MKYQQPYNIVFSDLQFYRWRRHFLFWLVVYLYHLLRIGIMMPSLNNIPSLLSLLQASFSWGLLPNILCTYSIVYYLIPKYFNRRRYFSFIVGIVVLILVMQTYGIVSNTLNVNTRFFNAILSTDRLTDTLLVHKAGLIRMLGNPPLIFGLFLSIKTLKNWHLEQLKTATLARENTNAELQLLKAQVHPHFLFNTLNNIYSFTLSQSALAGTLVQKLSDLLNYMIHDCDQALVPLEKEIKLIQDYIGLEKVRYGNRLDIQFESTGDYGNKSIAPLLMIPFIENCFKHGASVMRGQQWIKLVININGNLLDFNLSNSKPPQTIDTNKKGIGLANVQKRLELLYPGQHFLKIESTSNAYIVHLQVSLQQLPVLENIDEIMTKFQPVLYE